MTPKSDAATTAKPKIPRPAWVEKYPSVERAWEDCDSPHALLSLLDLVGRTESASRAVAAAWLSIIERPARAAFAWAPKASAIVDRILAGLRRWAADGDATALPLVNDPDTAGAVIDTRALAAMAESCGRELSRDAEGQFERHLVALAGIARLTQPLRLAAFAAQFAESCRVFTSRDSDNERGRQFCVALRSLTACPPDDLFENPKDPRREPRRSPEEEFQAWRSRREKD